MNLQFEFTVTPNIIFGAGGIKSLPVHLYPFGHKALIFVGNDSFMRSIAASELFEDLEDMKIEHFIIHIKGEPSPQQIDNICNVYRSWKARVVVAIGGGSVMDAGKAVSAMLCEEGSVSDYLEGVGTKQPGGRKIPFIAVPTTSGTGSETTKNAVLSKPGKDGFKKSLRHENYTPDIAIIDPQLSITCPAAITAASGMDAFTQLLESYVSTQGNSLTDVLALDGIEKLMRSIETAVIKGDDLNARSEMSYAAMLSGITLSNAGLGLTHGFAQALGSMFLIPHGVVCGTLMAATNRITIERLKEQSDFKTLAKYQKIAQMVDSGYERKKTLNDLLDFLDYLTEIFKLPTLSEYGVSKADIPTIILKTGLKNHPIELDLMDMEWILKQRL